MTNLEVINENLFESIKRVNEYGQEYWLARELQSVLGYKQWRRFESSIEKAKEACEGSGNAVDDHFANVGKMVALGSGSEREIVDYQLSRYAYYLIAMNGDSRKKAIALAQTYFAVKIDHMGGTELAANLFRITQTDEKLRRENVQGKENANSTHYQVWNKVRETIKELGGTLPKYLPTPDKSIKQIERENKAWLKLAEKTELE